MNRRYALKAIAAPVITSVLAAARPLFADSDFPIGPATERTPLLAEFEKRRLGVSFHFSMNTFTGNDYEEGKVPAATYNPTHLDVKQWIKAAHELGAKYAVLTAKHMSGFVLWNSPSYDYGVANSGNKTDVVAEFVSACHRYGIRPGYYYCILDPRNEGTPKVDWGGLVSPNYFALIRRQVTELHTNYPGAFYQIFDIPAKLTSEQRWELYRLVKSLTPNCLVVYNQTFDISRRNQGRVCDPGSWPTDIVDAEDTLPPPEGHDPHIVYQGKSYYMPFEAWIPTGPIYKPDPRIHSWFWREGYKTQGADAIASDYKACVKGSANLLLNFAPDASGRLPEETVRTMRDAARLIATA
jgi:alpha-L-fucosidase